MYRDRLSAKIARRLGRPQQAVNDLVQEALIDQRAHAEGLEVTDEELNAQIQAVPAFQEGGRFVLGRYQEFVRRRGLTAAAFEDEVRREVTRQKIERAVRGGVKVTPAEVEHAFALRREEARAAWALVELGPLIATATASDDELQKYLSAHGEEFRQPARRKILSVTLAQRDFLKPVADAEVERYYRDHAPEFEEPRRAHAAHVLARVPETGGSEGGGKKPLKDVAAPIRDKLQAEAAEKAMTTRAGELRPKLLAAKDFAAEAKALGLTAAESTVARTDGFASFGAPNPLEEAAFNLTVGGVSPPVKTPVGFVLLKAMATIPAGVPPLAQIKERVALAVRREKAEGQASARATRLAEEATRGDFLAAAKTVGAVTGETPRFSRAKPAEKLPGAAMLAVPRAPPGSASPPVKAPQGSSMLKAPEPVPA